MAEPTLYLFDGYNLLHAGGFGSPEELRDLLASLVAAQGRAGSLVFDGEGTDERLGSLEVRWAQDADTLLERLAAEHRGREQVAIVSSDAAVRGDGGDRGAEARVADVPRRALAARASRTASRGDLRDRLDPETLRAARAAAPRANARRSLASGPTSWVQRKWTCKSLVHLLSSPSTTG